MSTPLATSATVAERWFYWASLAVLLLGCARVAATHEYFSPTYDETFHISCGMQWWDQHEYTKEPKHTPLARVAAAAGPYFAGAQSTGLGEPSNDGEAMLAQLGYRHGLALARRGNLVFLTILGVTVWWWARRLGGVRAGFWALFAVLCLSPVLGHAGVAATDLALAATLPLALYLTFTWWRRPTTGAAARAGAGLALAVGCKLSVIIFYPAAALGVLAAGWRGGTRLPRRPLQWAVAVAVVLVLLLSFYQFRMRSMQQLGFPKPAEGSVVARIYQTPLPFVHLAAGLRQLMEHSASGHKAFLLGEFREHGWVYFFPLVFAVKTPLAFLVLIGITAVAVWRRRRQEPTLLEPLLAAACLMLSVLPSSINIGIRHILPMYPLLAVPVGVVAARWLEGSRAQRISCGVLLAWLAGASITAAPHYLADFNLLAGGRPERIRMDSDLDWGQDSFLLADRARALGIKSINMAALSLPFDTEYCGMPNTAFLRAGERASGWVAVSLSERTLRNAENGAYRWLDAYQPLERIGRTIDLYRIDNPAWPDPASALERPALYSLSEIPSTAKVLRIAEPLRRDIFGGDLRIFNSNGFDVDGDHGSLWLAHGGHGFRVLLWVGRAMVVKFSMEAAPGPMRTDNLRRLGVQVNGFSLREVSFDRLTPLTWDVALQAGVNELRLQTPDVRNRAVLDNGDYRDLLVRVQKMSLEP